MRVHYHIEALPFFRHAVITIGTFDGVHTGHQQLLQQLRNEALRIDGETVIITFDPHPRKIVSGHAKEIRLINTLEEKIGLLAGAGIDHLVVVPFTEAFSQLTASQYIEDFLVGRFHPHTIIIGYDHQFGKGRQGDYHLLESYCAPMNYELKEIPVHLSDSISVSSTRIREALTDADIDTANHLLGYTFFFSGRVVSGNRLGRTIGYPTANLEIDNPEKIVPGDGVYAVEAEIVSGERPLLSDELSREWSVVSDQVSGEWSVVSGDANDEASVGGESVGDQSSETDSGRAREMMAGSPKGGARYKGMMNIGLRPTVDGKKRVIEVNLFDFNEDIYDRKLRVYLVKHLRGEQKFSGLDGLREQLARDREEALQILSTK
ncbi:MAG: riboflavin biosynthesis protein RibF [Puia sp.]|nr:riboflavin biosynthesis protein RibF [Puia sp.]